MRARLYISKENLKYNIDYVKKKIKHRKIIAMVKANAYGIGDVIISKELNKLGVNSFGVANVEEALRLRKNKVEGMILITSVVAQDEVKDAIDENISMSVSDLDNIKYISKVAKEQKKIAKIHIKIDTGMTRLGFNIDNIIVNFNKIKELNNIKIEGIYTHLSCADSDKDYTYTQIQDFKKVVKELKKIQEFEYIHILNSDGTELYCNDVDFDTHVRVGLIMYGYGNSNTKPILKLTAPIIHINYVDKYIKVGYGGTYIAKPKTKIAVVKIGYADGFPRILSNKLMFKLNDICCQQVGNICMDMMMIDVSKVENIKVGDEIILWDFKDNLEDIAKKSNRIVYEVISSLGNRIERIIE